MKKNKYYIIYCLAFLLVLGSCKKQLDQQPGDAIADANAFQTFEHVQQGVNGAYGLFPAGDDMYTSALLTDEAKLGAGNAGQGALEYRYQFSSDATSGGSVTASYGDYYFMIDQVNRVLPNIYTVSDPVTYPPTVISAARKDEIKGQLLALRAVAHFGLLEAYAKKYDPTDPLGIPVMLESDPGIQPPRNTVAQALSQIETDLADAKALLPAVTPATFKDTVMNKINVAAYQARVALYKGDYDNAVTYATEVINSAVKPLASGSSYTGIWTDQNANETLFRIRYLTSSAIGSLWTTTGNVIYIAPSDKLISSYDAVNDIRYNAFIGTDANGNKYVNKFYVSSRGGRVVDAKLCRISEMYLIRAEAYAKKSSPNVAAGAADLNLLRSKRIAGYTDQTFASGTELANAVIDERYKELCFEGFRYFDLKRNNLPVQRSSTDASPQWQTLPAGSFRFTTPIPQAEINANPNMVQNPGY